MASSPKTGFIFDSLLIPVVGCAALISVGRKAAPAVASGDEATLVAASSSQRPRLRNARLSLAIGAATTVATLAGGGVAWAYVRGASGSGAGTAAVAAAPTVTTSNPSLSGPLYPGATVNLTVTLTNNSTTQSWSITGLAANGSATGCAASLTVQNGATFPATTVTPGNAATVTFTGALSMSSAASNTCQNNTFTVPVFVTGQMG